MQQHVIRLQGDLDFGSTARIRQQLGEALHQTDRLVLDMTRVDRLSSAIVAVLVDIQNRADMLGKAVELGPASDVAKRVLSLFRLDTAFQQAAQ